MGQATKHKNLYVELSPVSHKGSLAEPLSSGAFRLSPPQITSIPLVTDKSVYEVISGRERQMRTSPMHLLSEGEWKLIWPEAPKEALSNQTEDRGDVQR
jgi:hypothetical protein